MTDFWVETALAAMADERQSMVQNLMRAQAAAEDAGHTFYRTKLPHACLDDLLDEVRELDQAIRTNEGHLHVRNEMGDVLFSLVDICRRYNVSFDDALAHMFKRWLARKSLQEKKIKAAGYTWRTVPLELERQFWREVKVELKQSEYVE